MPQPMEHKDVSGAYLFFDPDERAAASIIEEACARSMDLIRQRWALASPADLRVYVMTSWPKVLFHAAPGPWKLYLALALPWLALRARAIWAYSGGWSFSLGGRRVMGVKPPHLIRAGNRSLGDQIFSPSRTMAETVQTITCHELVHAFTFHLRLPAWLQEGLATLAMEYYLERHFIRRETLYLLPLSASDQIGWQMKTIPARNSQALIALYARGYWLARYIDETKPGLMKQLLAERQKPAQLDYMLSQTLGISPQRFWQEVSGKMSDYFAAA